MYIKNIKKIAIIFILHVVGMDFWKFIFIFKFGTTYIYFELFINNFLYLISSKCLINIKIFYPIYYLFKKKTEARDEIHNFHN